MCMQGGAGGRELGASTCFLELFWSSGMSALMTRKGPMALVSSTSLNCSGTLRQCKSACQVKCLTSCRQLLQHCGSQRRCTGKVGVVRTSLRRTRCPPGCLRSTRHLKSCAPAESKGGKHGQKPKEPTCVVDEHVYAGHHLANLRGSGLRMRHIVHAIGFTSLHAICRP